MKNSLVSFKNVSFSYNGSREILKNISLEIPRGKVTAIMGGSGSGKTTVLRLISGQALPTKGSLTVFNEDMSILNPVKLNDLRKQMGMLFQFGALFTDMNVYNNVSFPIVEHTKLPKEIIDNIVAMKLEAVGLNGTQRLMPNELSGGMARRVALARAMAMDPELMIYDEPFTGLDPISLNTIAMLIKKLNTSLGQTSILVTHDIPATMEIADYVYFMSNGEVIAHGTPEEIKNTTNQSVKQFINGEVNGPFAYKYQSNTSYESILGLK